MRILQKPITARQGQQIEVTFSRPTNVKLLSAIEFKKYKRGKTHKYYGGWQETSPVIFDVPEDGLWHAVIEKGTYKNPIEVDGNAFIVAKKQIKGEKPKPVIAAIPEDIAEETVNLENSDESTPQE